MNWILTLSRNNRALTERALLSWFKQDVTVEYLIFDNGSTDGTVEWLAETHSFAITSPSNIGVSAGLEPEPQPFV
jgi:glycosyltransferase involved in cell wall biosynthesis